MKDQIQLNVEELEERIAPEVLEAANRPSPPIRRIRPTPRGALSRRAAIITTTKMNTPPDEA